MAAAMNRARAEGVTHMIFGDLFLEDVRRYREENTEMRDHAGISTMGHSDATTCGRDDRERTAFVSDLYRSTETRQVVRRARMERCVARGAASGGDPCGENGEFHTFACAGPMFRAPIPVRPGTITMSSTAYQIGSGT